MKKIIILCALVNISFGYSCYTEEQNYEDAIKYYESFQSDYNYKNAIEAKRSWKDVIEKNNLNT
ncbi:hypothetical protein DSX63_002205 [Campylobacter coli]|nr:hypothetical protein [Campylobacter coli]HEG3850153.1 hypothetical protein [Campylobacter coli]